MGQILYPCGPRRLVASSFSSVSPFADICFQSCWLFSFLVWLRVKGGHGSWPAQPPPSVVDVSAGGGSERPQLFAHVAAGDLGEARGWIPGGWSTGLPHRHHIESRRGVDSQGVFCLVLRWLAKIQRGTAILIQRESARSVSHMDREWTAVKKVGRVWWRSLWCYSFLSLISFFSRLIKKGYMSLNSDNPSFFPS